MQRWDPPIRYPALRASCVADGGCAYLRALSAIEHLAGYEYTARSYAAAAARCQHNGCWAASASDTRTILHRARGATVIPLHLARPSWISCKSAPANNETAVHPLTQSEIVDFVSDSNGNYIERHGLKLESLPGRNDSLGYLYEYWRGLCAATRYQFSEIDTVQLVRAGIIGRLHIVDVSSDNPNDFRYELFGYAVPGVRTERPRAHPISIYAERTTADYNAVRLSAMPHLCRIRSRVGGADHHYTQLILPFLDPHGRVSRLLVALQQHSNDYVARTG